MKKIKNILCMLKEDEARGDSLGLNTHTHTHTHARTQTKTEFDGGSGATSVQRRRSRSRSWTNNKYTGGCGIRMEDEAKLGDYCTCIYTPTLWLLEHSHTYTDDHGSQ